SDPGIAKSGQPPGPALGQLLGVATDHLDEDQLAELREHSAAADPRIAALVDRGTNERPEQTLGGFVSGDVEHPRQARHQRIEREHVATEKTTDDPGLVARLGPVA